MITKECNKYCDIDENGRAYHSIECSHFILTYAISAYNDYDTREAKLEAEGCRGSGWCKADDVFLETGRLHKENQDLQNRLDHAMALLSGPQLENFFDLTQRTE